MRNMPLVPVALALLAGIALAHLAPEMPTGSWVAAAAIATFAGGIMLILNHKHKDTILAALFLAAVFAAGGLRHHIADPNRDTLHWKHHCHIPDHLALRLTETPAPLEKSWRVKARIEHLNGHPVRGNATLFLRKDSVAASLRYGDRLLIHAHPDTARLSLYSTSDHYIITDRDTTSRRARIEQLRTRLLQRMQNGPLPPRHTALAAALTLGWKASLHPDTRLAFRDAGIAHLLAVSGLHVGLLAAIVGALLFWTGQQRRGRTLRGSAQLTAVWSFALLSGLAPAAMRAALMFSLFIISRILGRRTKSLNLLATAAIVTLSADPTLIADTGWQLSYSAVAGILLAKPLISRFRNPLWQSSIVSIAATAATTPVSLLTFHRFHPWFLLANIVVVPLAGLMLTLAILYLAIPCTATATPLEWLLRITETFLQAVAALPGATIETQ